MAQAEMAHPVCPSGEQFQNEAQEEKPAGKDPSSPRSPGAEEGSSSWLRRRGGGLITGCGAQNQGAQDRPIGTKRGEARAGGPRGT